MSAPRLYVDLALAAGTRVTLPAESARHAVRVLRCRRGDPLVLFDGRGGEYPGTVDSVSRQDCVVVLGEHCDRDVESPLDLQLVQGLSRGDRMDTVVQKATELGVRRITPLAGEHSVVRLAGERAEKRLRHWQRVSLSACEQCGRNRPPRVDAPLSLGALLELPVPEGTRRLLLDPSAELPLAAAAGTAAGALQLLVGPEGGFSDEERERVLAAGFVSASLGPRVLRTETAAIAAVTLVQARLGDLAPRG